MKEAATHLGCSPRAVRAGLANGRISGYKRGGHRVVPRSSLTLAEAGQADATRTIDDMHAAVDEATPSLGADLGAIYFCRQRQEARLIWVPSTSVD